MKSVLAASRACPGPHFTECWNTAEGLLGFALELHSFDPIGRSSDRGIQTYPTNRFELAFRTKQFWASAVQSRPAPLCVGGQWSLCSVKKTLFDTI